MIGFFGTSRNGLPNARDGSFHRSRICFRLYISSGNSARPTKGPGLPRVSQVANRHGLPRATLRPPEVPEAIRRQLVRCGISISVQHLKGCSIFVELFRRLSLQGNIGILVVQGRPFSCLRLVQSYHQDAVQFLHGIWSGRQLGKSSVVLLTA